MKFSRQEYWSRLPCPSSGNFHNPVIKPGSPAWQADSLPSQRLGKPGSHLQSYCQTSISVSPDTQIKSSNRKFWANNKNTWAPSFVSRPWSSRNATYYKDGWRIKYMQQKSARHFIHLQTFLCSKNIDLDSCVHNVGVEIVLKSHSKQTCF